MEQYLGFVHVDGDYDRQHMHIPECKEVIQNRNKAYLEYWNKGLTPPDELWQPFYKRMCDRAKTEVEINKKSRVVMTHTIGRAEIRDYVR